MKHVLEPITFRDKVSDRVAIVHMLTLVAVMDASPLIVEPTMGIANPAMAMPSHTMTRNTVINQLRL
jgi:hypothetical protein